MRPGGDGTNRRIESAVTLLPQPLSPTTASVSPALDRVGDAVNGAHDTVAGKEMRLEILDREERCARPALPHMRRANRGSSASRKPSPTRFTARTVSDRKMPGKIIR